MAGRSPGLTKAYDVGAKVEKRRIVKFDSSDGVVIKSAAATDKHIGVSSEIDAETTDRCDVFRDGLAEVDYGGTITRGDMLTSDASGKAVATTTANDRYVGIAEVSGVSGDVGVVLICPGIV